MLRDMLQPARRNMLRGMFTSTSALTRFGINGVEAALALDFIGGEYRTANAATTFADAFTGNSPKLTYSTAAGSNSTMTQGYGPELVTDIGWSEGTGWTISDGVAVHSGTTAGNLTQSVFTVGRTYEASWEQSGGQFVAVYGDSLVTLLSNSNSDGAHSVVFTPTISGDFSFRTNADGASISNISVREAPKIVWAPHNLVDYSEDFSQWNSNAATLDVTLHEAPDGTQTARKLVALASASSSEHFLYRSNSEELGSQGKIAIFAKADEYDNLRIIELTGYRYYASFDLGSGNPPSRVSASGGANFVSASATPVGGGWFLCEIVTNRSTAGAFSVMGFPDGSAPTNAPANYTGDGTSGIYVWGAHVYRSDLGGMHPVPGAVGDFQYYVPTNGSAEYLPRVGHHVYNGTAWVNEGLLIESEARTNLVTYSDFSSGWGTFDASLDPSSVVSPDGKTNALKFVEGSGSSIHRTNGQSITVYSGVKYTASVYAKAGERSNVLLRTYNGSVDEDTYFDLSSGAVVSGTGSVEDIGNGWFRLSRTVTATATTSSSYIVQLLLCSAGTTTSYQGDGTSGIYIWGAQLDQGQVVNGTPVDAPTPSSYIPTNGSTVTRGGQSLTVPPAQFGWPEPEFIGPELVTNGGFDTGDLTGWGGSATYQEVSGNGTAFIQRSADSTVNTSIELYGNTTGKVLHVTFDVVQGSGNLLINEVETVTATSGQSYSFVIVTTAQNNALVFRARCYAGGSANIDNISVREINPLSVSIQMDGRMTYADEDVTTTAKFTQWNAGGGVYIEQRLDTASTDTGRVAFAQQTGGAYDSKSVDAYSPGVLVPFNIASRHGSTFINGAVDGAALTADTTPTALPDLSNTNLQIASDFMGTIGTFRQFAGDIEDAGLVTATNPSTEPTLSLTFDGTGGSFYNLNWSE